VRGREISNEIRISGKNLGEIGKPEFCPRCYWIKLRMRNKLPFSSFPGIFSSIDSYTKKIIHGCFNEKKKAPECLRPLGKILNYMPPPHFSKFQVHHQETNILLTGSADAIFQKTDGTYVIADYKTAKFTDNQDELYELYDIQLNSYAFIAKEVGYKTGFNHPVSGLALIYLEPMTDCKEGFSKFLRSHGFDLGFSAHIVNIPINLSKIDAHLRTARQIFDGKIPISNSRCTDCLQLSELISAVKSESNFQLV
jgi:hypothetical protein